MWKRLIAERGDASLLRLLQPPEYPTVQDLAKADWVRFRELRNIGKHPSSLLSAIRRDSEADFLSHVAQHDYAQVIPYSLYEQYFHFDYEITVGPDNRPRVALPKIVDAIALLGAVSCWATLMSEERINKEEVLGQAARSIIAHGSTTGFLAGAIDAGMVIEGRSLESAVRFHDNKALVHLLDSQGALVTDDAIAAALVYANFTAFEIFHGEGLAKFFADATKPGMLHYIAKGNAITAFKLTLATEEVDPCRKTTTKRSFLHWAADYGAYDVAEFWLEKLGVAFGLDAVDEAAQSPAGIAFARVPYARPPKDAHLPATEKCPLYGLFTAAIERFSQIAVEERIKELQ
jgi:hypothetical protein